MGIRLDIASAESIVRDLKRLLREGGRTPRDLGNTMRPRLQQLGVSAASAKAADTNPDSAPVYAQLVAVIENAKRDVEEGNMNVANMTENVNKMEEYITDVARRANIGGRRRRKTRKTRKGKKGTRRRRIFA